jgi:hypothetical protein
MSRAQPTCLGNVNDPKNLTRHSERLAKVLNANVNYGTTMANDDEDNNMQAWKATGTTPGTANTDFTIKHSLNRIPLTINAQDTNNGGLLYRSPATAWTKTTVTLRCTTASAAYNVIVI